MAPLFCPVRCSWLAKLAKYLFWDYLPVECIIKSLFLILSCLVFLPARRSAGQNLLNLATVDSAGTVGLATIRSVILASNTLPQWQISP